MDGRAPLRCLVPEPAPELKISGTATPRQVEVQEDHGEESVLESHEVPELVVVDQAEQEELLEVLKEVQERRPVL